MVLDKEWESVEKANEKDGWQEYDLWLIWNIVIQWIVFIGCFQFIRWK